MIKKLFSALIAFVAVLFVPFIANAQVTTATLNGMIKDAQNKPIANAVITIKYEDAGIKQTLKSLSDGRFVLANLRVGGPYSVSVNKTGYQTQNQNDVYLDLGSNSTLLFQLKLDSEAAGDVVVTATGLNNKKTGAASTINNRLLRALPTISRSADDFLRLAPSASATYNGVSFGGRNGQYNNFSLDGAVFNNPFGLDAPTPGGQAGAQPISLDAIDQIQINIAPYDVAQAGFTGAGVNTVTKSGTNNFTGTVYNFYRSKGMTGKKVDGTKQEISNLSQYQAGATLGGAIKKNKLFYFLSFETEQREDAGSGYNAQNASNVGKSNTARVLEADLLAVRSILKSKFGYETGDYQGYTHKQTNYKWLAKLDWNINASNKLSFTYNGLDAKKDKPGHPTAIGRRGPDFTTLQFRNSGYQMVNRLNSFSSELKSNFDGKAANKLRVVYTEFRDKRNPFSDPFPVVNITKFGSRYIIAGQEPFSINNNLKQNAFQVTNDFNLYRGKHTYTFGASYESFKFANSFNLTGYGPTLFSEADINTFKDSVPVSGRFVFGAYPLDVDVNYARKRAAANKWQLVEFTVAQLSAYAQDEIQVNDKFKLTVGLRIDKPLYLGSRFSTPNINADGSYAGSFTTADVNENTIPNTDNLTLFDANGNPIQNGVGKALDNTKLPSGNPLFSPRVGFSYNIKNNKTALIRGGTGLFTGRFPFVWVGNHIGNPFSFFYNVTDRKFKWPQVWRTNLGFDFKIPTGTVFTTDLSYTKDVNAMMVRNYRLGKPTGTLASGTGDNRKVYKATDQGNANAYVFTNTKVGYQFNASVQATHNFKNGLYVMAGYNFLIAKDASSISAEISSDAFDRNPILNNANEAKLSPSLYGNTHRFIVAATKRFKWNEKHATSFSLFGNWTSGNRFAYVYGGDINNDNTNSNDLLYVPTTAELNVMNFASFLDINGVSQNAATQRAAFEKFIIQDKYLSKNRGKFTEKYGAATPGFSQVDIRIMHEKGTTKNNKFQISLDLINAGNLLSSKWGVRKTATNAGYFQPLAVNVVAGTPVYQFDPSQKTTFISTPDLISRWQMQIGLRYIF